MRCEERDVLKKGRCMLLVNRLFTVYRTTVREDG
jgi:hypothetical protein